MYESPTFGVHFSNVPLINLRWEFRDFYERVHVPGFLQLGIDKRGTPIQTRYFHWVGMPDACATMMLSRSIVGLEAYISAAAANEGALRGRMTEDLRVGSRNPFALGRKAADNYYNRLPGLVDADLAMKVSAPQLWAKTHAFYREVRNHIFHGRQFDTISELTLAALFDQLAEIYRWVDGWHDPDQIVPGAARSFTV